MKQFQNFEEENIDYWTGRTDGYSNVNQEELASDQKVVWSGVLAKKITAHFPKKTPEEIRVLDIGTGPGFFAIILAKMGYQVTAVDYTASMLEAAVQNAGEMAEKIQFQQMNAEELDFAEGSFDVIVSRNLTWNLHHPEKAYGEWVRVLKKNGLLLNFDANWYRYLWDETAHQGHEKDRKNLSTSDVRDETEGTDVAAMEAIARQTPLSEKQRPEWDLTVMQTAGMEAKADSEIWKEVWTKEERINNASTPMFLVEGVKKRCVIM